MTDGECFSDDTKHYQNVGSIRFKDGTEIVQTVYIINQDYLITTARFLKLLYSYTVKNDDSSDPGKAGDGKLHKLQRKLS